MKYLIRATKKTPQKAPVELMRSNDRKEIYAEYEVQKNNMFLTGNYSFVGIFELINDEYVMIERFREGKTIVIK